MEMKLREVLNGDKEKYMMVSKEMIGKTIEIKIGYANYSYRFSNICFVDNNNNILLKLIF